MTDQQNEHNNRLFMQRNNNAHVRWSSFATCMLWLMALNSNTLLHKMYIFIVYYFNYLHTVTNSETVHKEYMKYMQLSKILPNKFSVITILPQ